MLEAGEPAVRAENAGGKKAALQTLQLEGGRTMRAVLILK